MKICPKCGKEHLKSGNFCSLKCANSRVFSDEAKRKISLALKGKSRNLSESQMESFKKKMKEVWEIKYNNTNFDDLGPENRRRRVLEEQNFCCNRCGISDWFGEKITLELDHIDGISDNNSRENLEGLCPNCHSLTETWRGRNKPTKNGENIVTDDFLLECLLTTKNIRQGLIKAGIAAKGNNYQRAKKILRGVGNSEEE